MNWPFRPDDAVERGTTTGMNWPTLTQPDVGRRSIVSRDGAECTAVIQVQCAELCFGDARRLLQNRSKTDFKSPGEELMTLRISDAADSCSNASSRSWASRAAFVSRLAAEERLRPAAFDAARRFGVTALRRLVLTGSPPAPERRFIAFPYTRDRTS